MRGIPRTFREYPWASREPQGSLHGLNGVYVSCTNLQEILGGFHGTSRRFVKYFWVSQKASMPFRCLRGKIQEFEEAPEGFKEVPEILSGYTCLCCPFLAYTRFRINGIKSHRLFSLAVKLIVFQDPSTKKA